MQFQVPQNIAIEDKIVGPLTAIQFAIFVIGGIPAFMIFSSQSIPYPVNMLIGGSLALLTLTFGAGRFNDQPMYRFIRHIIYFLARPKTRIWRKGGPETTLIRPAPPHADAQHLHASHVVSRRDIAGLAVLLDSRGSSGSIPSLEQPASKPHSQP